MMRAFLFVAEVDENRNVQVTLPPTAPSGRARVLVLLPDETTEDETDTVWMQALAREWSDELADEREDIYSLEDGEPVDAAR